MSRGGDFWSRRKARVEAEEAERDAARAAEAERVAEQARAEEEHARLQALEERPDEDILAELGLPDPDTLNRGDDFRAFLAREVPERLRRRALRRLWRSDPVLACLDGLNDYDEDYTNPAKVGDAVRTAYKVGEGFARQVLEATPDGEDSSALTAEGGAAGAPAVADAETAGAGTDETGADKTADKTGPADAAEAAGADMARATPEEPEGRPAPQRRRMRFDFQNGA